MILNVDRSAPEHAVHSTGSVGGGGQRRTGRGGPKGRFRHRRPRCCSREQQGGKAKPKGVKLRGVVQAPCPAQFLWSQIMTIVCHTHRQETVAVRRTESRSSSRPSLFQPASLKQLNTDTHASQADLEEADALSRWPMARHGARRPPPDSRGGARAAHSAAQPSPRRHTRPLRTTIPIRTHTHTAASVAHQRGIVPSSHPIRSRRSLPTALPHVDTIASQHVPCCAV